MSGSFFNSDWFLPNGNLMNQAGSALSSTLGSMFGSGSPLAGVGQALGIGGGPAQQQPFAQPFQSKGGQGMGAPALNTNQLGSASDYAQYGPNAPGLAGLGPSASFAPPLAPPPAAPLSPAGGGANPNAINNYLSSSGGGPTTTPIDPNALANNLNQGGWTQQNVADSMQQDVPWYSNPSYWQGASAVGSAYLKYLADSGKAEFAHPFSSTVVPTPMNPLAPVKSSPIAPPALVV